MKPHGRYSFVSGSFCLVLCQWDLLTLCVAVFPSTCCCVGINYINIWIIQIIYSLDGEISWLSGIKLIQIFSYPSLLNTNTLFCCVNTQEWSCCITGFLCVQLQQTAWFSTWLYQMTPQCMRVLIVLFIASSTLGLMSPLN